jgi:hypothetical protein
LKPSRIAIDVFAVLFSFILCALTIFVIVKFAKFALKTRLFEMQSIFATVIWVVFTVMYLATGDFFDGIFPGVAMLTSVWMCVYVIKVRKRVKRGELGEMKRPVGESGEAGRDVELEGGREEVPAVGAKIAVALVERPVRPSPSLSSVATASDAAGPPKQPREFV